MKSNSYIILFPNILLIFEASVMMISFCFLQEWGFKNGPHSLQVNHKLVSYTEGKERRKREADHATLARGSFNKQGNLLTRLILRGHKMSRSLHLPASVLNVYRETSVGFNQVFSSDGLNNTLLPQGCVLGTAPSVGTVDRVYIPRTEEGASNCRGPAGESAGGHILLITSSNTR